MKKSMILSNEFIKYCLVGLINTLVGISTAYVLLNPMHQSYNLSVITAYITGIIVSFILNKRFTFKFEKGSNIVLFLKFAVSMLPCYLISYYLIGPWSAKYILRIEVVYKIAELVFMTFGVLQDRIVDNFTVIISMAVYLVSGFALNKYFIFRK